MTALVASVRLEVTVWLLRTGWPYQFVQAPMTVVLSATLTSRAFIVGKGMVNVVLTTGMNAAVAVVLLVLSITIPFNGLEEL